MTEQVYHNLAGSDFVVLESNHDVGMLKTGNYPYILKQRIISDYGHLSNATRPNRCVMFQLEHSIYHLSEKHNLRKI